MVAHTMFVFHIHAGTSWVFALHVAASSFEEEIFYSVQLILEKSFIYLPNTMENHNSEIMLSDFLPTLKNRNNLLYHFGLICFISAIVLAVVMQFDSRVLLGVSIWNKPFKFFLSTTIYVWTMGWLCEYLNKPRAVKWYSWMLFITLSTELIYITGQSFIGETSHFNMSSPLNAVMWPIMGLFAGTMVTWTGYMGILFFIKKLPQLSSNYLWGIRLGIILFVIFGFEGYLMGAHNAHTIGAVDGGEGLPVTGWSTKHGDLRIAHFLGMHALQIVPLFAYFFTKKVWQTVLFAMLYLAIVTGILLQALAGKPFLPL